MTKKNCFLLLFIVYFPSFVNAQSENQRFVYFYELKKEDCPKCRYSLFYLETKAAPTTNNIKSYTSPPYYWRSNEEIPIWQLKHKDNVLYSYIVAASMSSAADTTFASVLPLNKRRQNIYNQPLISCFAAIDPLDGLEDSFEMNYHDSIQISTCLRKTELSLEKWGTSPCWLIEQRYAKGDKQWQQWIYIHSKLLVPMQKIVSSAKRGAKRMKIIQTFTLKSIEKRYKQSKISQIKHDTPDKIDVAYSFQYADTFGRYNKHGLQYWANISLYPQDSALSLKKDGIYITRKGVTQKLYPVHVADTLITFLDYSSNSEAAARGILDQYAIRDFPFDYNRLHPKECQILPNQQTYLLGLDTIHAAGEVRQCWHFKKKPSEASINAILCRQTAQDGQFFLVADIWVDMETLLPLRRVLYIGLFRDNIYAKAFEPFFYRKETIERIEATKYCDKLE